MRLYQLLDPPIQLSIRGSRGELVYPARRGRHVDNEFIYYHHERPGQVALLVAMDFFSTYLYTHTFSVDGHNPCHQIGLLFD